MQNLLVRSLQFLYTDFKLSTIGNANYSYKFTGNFELSKKE